MRESLRPHARAYGLFNVATPVLHPLRPAEFDVRRQAPAHVAIGDVEAHRIVEEPRPLEAHGVSDVQPANLDQIAGMDWPALEKVPRAAAVLSQHQLRHTFSPTRAAV